MRPLIKIIDFKKDGWIFADRLAIKINIISKGGGNLQYQSSLCSPDNIPVGSIFAYVNRYFKEVEKMAIGGAAFDLFGDGIKVILWQVDDQKCSAIFFEGKWMQLDSCENFRISPLFSQAEDSENYYLCAAEINVFNKADRQDLIIDPIIIYRKGFKPVE